MRVKIIAEAGVNHNGNLKIAKKLVDIAKDAKADYIKFQSFFHDKLVVKKGIKARYQKINSNKNETQREMLKKLQLSKLEQVEIIKYCHNNFFSITFLIL